MEPILSARLGALPRLGLASQACIRPACKVCGNPGEFFDVTDFWKGSESFQFGPSGISIQYYRCRTCGFMWAPAFDDWSVEDFRRYIYNDEYVLVDGEYLEIRPKRVSAHIAKLLAGFEESSILDYGSGSGLFAQYMRDEGFLHVTSFDPLSEPERPIGTFDIITCFEVIEHSPTPRQLLDDMAFFLGPEGCIILGESLQPPDIASLRCNWWYCMPRNGHISLYTDRALAILAGPCGLLFHPGTGLHAFSRPVAGRFTEFARLVSDPLFPIALTAPSIAAAQDDTVEWHGVEHFNGTSARWTASSDLSWSASIPPSAPVTALIRVPFSAEVLPNFAARCRLVANGADAPTSLEDGAIVAKVRIADPGRIQITLHTPPVVSPSELRESPDTRALGLAIPCEDEATEVAERIS